MSGFQVPPGIGEEDAPFDSVEWAKSVRTGLLGHSYALPKVAGHVADYLSMLRETGGWAQLNKPDGSTFATLEEFCAHRRPWGLGMSLADLERWTRADGPASAPLYWNPENGENNTAEPEIHPAANLFPMLGALALADLAADIKANGLREPVIIWKGLVLDGRNRLAACKLADVPPTFAALALCPDPVAYVLSANLHRRHLTDDDRALCAAQMKAHYQGKTSAAHAEGVKAGGRGKVKTLAANAVRVSDSRWYDIAGQDWKVSAGAVQRADGILAQRDTLPELHDAVKVERTVTLSAAATLAKAVGSGDLAADKVKEAIAAKGGAVKLVNELRAKRAASKPKPSSDYDAALATAATANRDTLDFLAGRLSNLKLTAKQHDAVIAAIQARHAELRTAAPSAPANDDAPAVTDAPVHVFTQGGATAASQCGQLTIDGDVDAIAEEAAPAVSMAELGALISTLRDGLRSISPARRVEVKAALESLVTRVKGWAAECPPKAPPTSKPRPRRSKRVPIDINATVDAISEPPRRPAANKAEFISGERP